MAKKKKTVTVKATLPLTETGAVIYTDGSASPNPGYGGWGFHGYTYNNEQVPTLLTSQKRDIVTNKGYLNVSDFDAETTPVTLLAKVDGYGSSPYPAPTNNNRMEVYAFNRLFQYAEEKPWQTLTIYSDSKYAIGACSHWYNNWSKNGWLNSKGEPIKDKELIMDTHARLDALKQRMKVDIHHIKAHVGHTGNEAADKLAKRGTVLHHYGKTMEEIKEEKKGQPKVKPEYHHFFTKNRWYFYSGEAWTTPVVHGYHRYNVGVVGYGKKDADFGMHMADGFSGVVLLKEPEPVVERVQGIYNQLCNTDYSYVVAGRLDTLLTPANYEEIVSENAPQFICHDKLDKTLLLPSGKVVCSEYNPVHLSFLQMERYQQFDGFINYLLVGNEETVLGTDITSSIIATTLGKKEKKAYQLDSKVASNNGVKASVACYTKTGQVMQPVMLTTKVDLPDKVHLAKLIRVYGDQLSIKVLTYPRGEGAWRYVTAISLTDNSAHGLWSNFDSSFLYAKGVK